MLSFNLGRLSALNNNIEGRLIGMEQKIEEKISKMEKKVQHALGRMILLPSAILTITIEPPCYDIRNISYVKPGKLWVTINEYSELIQVDIDGNIIQGVDLPELHCVTEDGALLYTSDPVFDDKNEHSICIRKRTSLSTVTLFKTDNCWKVIAIHSSLINGHILVFMIETNPDFVYVSHKITRYDNDGMKIQDIWKNDSAEEWQFIEIACITENTNEDIIISYDEKTVVGLDKSGGHRFMYSHPEDLTPMDICTDKYGHILVAFTTSIRLLDEDGTSQKILLKNMSGYDFSCLCLDERQKLYVGNNRGIVKVYKYLKDD